MKFQLEDVVPWGKNLNEYKKMFNLSDEDLNKQIISFADGTSSFNLEMTRNKGSVISLDPIYQYGKAKLSFWINMTIEQIQNNTSGNRKREKDLTKLEKIRIQAINDFISDFQIGKTQNRYAYYMFPNRTNYDDQCFDLGLCANFLLLYAHLGLSFHKKSIKEMLRLCKEIRIFPIIDFKGERPIILKHIINCFCAKYRVEIVKVDYGFQGKGYEMLSIKWR